MFFLYFSNPSLSAQISAPYSRIDVVTDIKKRRELGLKPPPPPQVDHESTQSCCHRSHLVCVCLICFQKLSYISVSILRYFIVFLVTIISSPTCIGILVLIIFVVSIAISIFWIARLKPIENMSSDLPLQRMPS